MNKAVHALVYVILAVAIVAVFFEMKLFEKKELLTDSNEQLRKCIVDLSSYIEAENAGASAEIQPAVAAAVDEYVLWQKSKLGRDINPSELIRRMVNAGAKRVEVTSPIFTAVTGAEVAIAGTVSVSFGGADA